MLAPPQQDLWLRHCACLYCLSGGVNVGVCFVRCAVVVLFCTTCLVQFGAYEMLFEIGGLAVA